MRKETSSDIKLFRNWTNVTLVSDNWLKFDEQDRRFYGTPQKQDINKY